MEKEHILAFMDHAPADVIFELLKYLEISDIEYLCDYVDPIKKRFCQNDIPKDHNIWWYLSDHYLAPGYIAKDGDNIRAEFMTRFKDLPREKNRRLLMASELGYFGIIEDAIKQGADIKYYSLFHTPLSEAAGGGYMGIVKYLLEHGLNSQYQKILH